MLLFARYLMTLKKQEPMAKKENMSSFGSKGLPQ
jgi:hypothetical protein